MHRLNQCSECCTNEGNSISCTIFFWNFFSLHGPFQFPRFLSITGEMASGEVTGRRSDMRWPRAYYDGILLYPPESAVPWDHSVILPLQGPFCQPREGTAASLVVVAWLLLWAQWGCCRTLGNVTEPCESDGYSLISSLKPPQITLRIKF